MNTDDKNLIKPLSTLHRKDKFNNSLTRKSHPDYEFALNI